MMLSIARYRFINILIGAALVLHHQVHCEEHDIIVHLFEWKFDDIARECTQFLAPNGYTGVQVSPVNEYAVLPGRPWYERYQPFSYKFQTRSGNEDEFKAMVNTCNKANVKIYVDVVFNHMSATLPPGTRGSAGSPAITENKSYPEIPYTAQNFHKTCQILDYQVPEQVRNCELVGLHDLDHSQPIVRKKIVDFLNKLIKIGVAGFRVDAAKHMWPEQLKEIYNKLDDLNTEAGFKTGTRPLIFQEVIDYGSEPISKYQYTDLGLVTEFKYAREVSNSFRGNNPLKWFQNFGPEWGLLESKYALAFIDNHDSQRSGDVTLTYKDPRLYKMAVGYMLSWPYGTKRVMSSFDFMNHEQGPPHNADMSIKTVTTNLDLTCNNGWVCEHRWRPIYNMVGFSNIVKGTNVEQFWTNDNNQISFCRGNKGFVAFNLENYDLNRRLLTCLPPGKYCDIISGHKNGDNCTGKTITVDAENMANIFMSKTDEDGILAIHIESKL